MTTWILVTLIQVTGLVSGIKVDTVGEFQTQEACLAAAEQLIVAYDADFDSRRLKTLCLPTSLEENQ